MPCRRSPHETVLSLKETIEVLAEPSKGGFDCALFVSSNSYLDFYADYVVAETDGGFFHVGLGQIAVFSIAMEEFDFALHDDVDGSLRIETEDAALQIAPTMRRYLTRTG
jgi:hypothetical protein